MNTTTSTPNPIIFDLIALTKPRVNFLIIFTAIVGMLLAQDFNLNYGLMIYASIGIYLAASAAAVINQIVDQKIDAIMDRTKSRPLSKEMLLRSTPYISHCLYLWSLHIYCMSSLIRSQ